MHLAPDTHLTPLQGLAGSAGFDFWAKADCKDSVAPKNLPEYWKAVLMQVLVLVLLVQVVLMQVQVLVLVLVFLLLLRMFIMSPWR